MKKTKSRKQILELLENSDKAFSAQEIHEKLESTDLTTVYRNLNKFVELGIVRELRLDKTESRYEINKDNHEHAICTDCGKVRHVDIDKKQLIHALDLEGFDIDDIEVNIKGRCATKS